MFWDIYRKSSHYGKRFFYSLSISPSFSSHPFHRRPLPLPEEYGRIEHITSTSPKDHKQEICDFLMQYFCIRGSSTSIRSPLLYFTVDTLFENENKDHIFLIRNEKDGIIATVRYHWIGYFMGFMGFTENKKSSSSPVMYLVDGLCVHPNWRGKQLVEYLLTELHAFANKMDIPNAVFLEEGHSSLPLFPLPFYISKYVYRNLSNKSAIKHNPSTSILTLSQEKAFTWITIYLQLYPETIFIGHHHSKNVKWLLYRNRSHRILVGIQNTHQIFPETNETMGWITAWLEIGDISNEDRNQASLEITDDLSSDFDWIWMDRIWAGGDQKSDEWMEDGDFKWYNYQWESSKIIRNSYGILI
jgi:hypothetical protein